LRPNANHDAGDPEVTGGNIENEKFVERPDTVFAGRHAPGIMMERVPVTVTTL